MRQITDLFLGKRRRVRVLLFIRDCKVQLLFSIDD
jgi:hypothetical protein